MPMKVTKIWLSPDSEKKSRYGLRTLGGIVGITVLALLLVTIAVERFALR